jgi:hypothetical protein
MKPPEIQLLLGEMTQALGALYGPDYQKQAESYGLPDGPLYNLIVSHDFLPDDTSPARFLVRTPYTSWKVYSTNLATLAERGLIDPVGPGTYRLNDAGKRIVHELEDTLNRLLGRYQPLPAADLERLAGLLGRLVEASLHAPEPADKPSISANRHSDPGPQGAVLLRILQYRSDLNSFRDDAHLAAWRPLGISGPAWEAFTYVWRGDARTAAEMAEKQAFRQISAADYARLLDELVEKGWLTVTDGAYATTEGGAALRQQVEDLTDQTYYAPWQVLNEGEQNDLGNLLVALRDALKALAEPAAQPA